MSTATETDLEIDLDEDVRVEGDMVITLDVGPGGLDRYLEMVGDRTGPRIKCLDGSLTLVSPSHPHERGGGRINEVVKMICEELDIDNRTTESTLFRPAGRKNDGIGPDCSFYIEHQAATHNAGDKLDLARIPPPDLLIEVVVTHGPSKALRICQLLGVPEVWVHRPMGGKLQFLHLENGQYVARKRSRSFPFLGPEDVLPWLGSPEDEPDNRWRRRLRGGVREVLGPRRAEANREGR